MQQNGQESPKALGAAVQDWGQHGQWWGLPPAPLSNPRVLPFKSQGLAGQEHEHSQPHRWGQPHRTPRTAGTSPAPSHRWL